MLLTRPRLAFIPDAWRGVDPALVLAIAFLPLGWGTLIRLGGFSLEPFHISMLLVVGVTFCRPSAYAQAVSIIREFWPFFLGYALYFFLQFFSFSMTRNFGALDFYIIKQAMFFLYGMAVAVRVINCRSVTRTLYWGGVAGIILFVFAIIVSAGVAGVSAVDAFVNLATTGNYHNWTWGFLPKVFNAFVFPSGGRDFLTALKNNIGTGLLIAFLCYRAGATIYRSSPRMRLIDAAVTLVFLFCILMMLSRSVMLAMILCIVIVIAVDSIVRNSAFAFVGVLAAVAAALVLYVAMPPELLAALQERFFGDTGSFDARVDVYRESIPVIEQRFWIGSGIGSQGEGGSSIHNLFLSTWWNAGVLGFLASALFWTAAVLMIVRHLLRIIQGVYAQSHDLALFHAWIAVVPLTGLIRCWLIGGGVLNFSAWFALGLFFGVLYRDAMVRRARAAAPPASGLAAGSLLPR